MKYLILSALTFLHISSVALADCHVETVLSANRLNRFKESIHGWNAYAGPLSDNERAQVAEASAASSNLNSAFQPGNSLSYRKIYQLRALASHRLSRGENVSEGERRSLNEFLRASWSVITAMRGENSGSCVRAYAPGTTFKAVSTGRPRSRVSVGDIEINEAPSSSQEVVGGHWSSRSGCPAASTQVQGVFYSGPVFRTLLSESTSRASRALNQFQTAVARRMADNFARIPSGTLNNTFYSIFGGHTANTISCDAVNRRVSGIEHMYTTDAARFNDAMRGIGVVNVVNAVSVLNLLKSMKVFCQNSGAIARLSMVTIESNSVSTRRGALRSTQRYLARLQSHNWYGVESMQNNQDNGIAAQNLRELETRWDNCWVRESTDQNREEGNSQETNSGSARD